jgi:hypothetical protein
MKVVTLYKQELWIQSIKVTQILRNMQEHFNHHNSQVINQINHYRIKMKLVGLITQLDKLIMKTYIKASKINLCN